MQKILLPILLVLSVLLGTQRRALANCAPLDVAAWTANQRRFLEATILTTLGEPVDLTWIKDKVGETEIKTNTVRVCVQLADASTLDGASLQAQAQTLWVAQDALDTAKATETSEILTELTTSPICRTATLTQLNARIDAELDTQKTAIQADIDAATNIATAKVAMTTMNTRLTATVKQTTKQLAKCMVGYMRLQQQQQ